MKSTAIVFLVLCIGAVAWYLFSFSVTKPLSPLSSGKAFSSVTPTITSLPQKESTAVFVPYWAFSKKRTLLNNDTLLYFGISANENGIDTTDAGYKNVAQFNTFSKNAAKKLLVVRMTNSPINSKVLEDKNTQKNIIQESIGIAKRNGFSGIVLDFEIKALAFDSVVKNITQFYTNFATQTHKNNLQFDAALYGDTFYRARPYDVKTIGQQVDNIYIMAYDFHKAGSNPGPNFPLFGKDMYGYDLKNMISDFSKQVPSHKLIVVFGLFGYDWTVDRKNQSVDTGESLSFAEISTKYVARCSQKSCVMKRDSTSAETHISYTDTDGQKHIIWFEDLQSMEKKKAFLSTKGINATGIWAYSYY